MSEQSATVNIAPAATILDKLFNKWGYTHSGFVTFDCYAYAIDLNITLVSWDGSQLKIAGTFTSPCTGYIKQIAIYLYEKNKNFYGLANLFDVDARVEQNQSYTIYYAEKLNKPTTASVKGP